MPLPKVLILAGCLVCLLHVVKANDQIPKPTPSRHFDHYVQLDTTGQYWLFWTYNDTHVTFETHVNTHGYVGFGISPNGKMFPADVIVGGVKDGQSYFKDYHTIQHAPPIVDQSQDWFLLSASETASGTVLTFVRKLHTCDSNDDMVITSDTSRIIYSYHPNDVTDDNIPYHGATRRGTKSVMLLTSSLTAEDVGFPSDVTTFDMVHDNYHVPAVGTTYSCRSFMLPKLSSKHHMIKYEPVLTPGNELNVHHIVVYRCDKRASELTQYNGTVFMCETGATAPEPLRGCLFAVVIAWAVGGGAFYYPPDAGYSLGTDDDPDFVVMQTHYDNPQWKSGIVDSSGIRISMTPTLRTHDAGALTVAMGVSKMHIIPPMEAAFVSQGFCPQQLLQKGIPPEGIRAFALLQHSHLLGKEMVTRHFRNGRELKPLAVDRHYDFNYQDTRYMTEERLIYPTDSLEIKCIYDSTGKRNVTYGGYSTQEEMCEAFILYYPRVPLDICGSVPLYNKIASTDHLFNVIHSWNWTDPAVRANFKTALDTSNFYHFAMGSTSAVNGSLMTTHLETSYPYVEPIDTSCPVHAGPIVG